MNALKSLASALVLVVATALAPAALAGGTVAAGAGWDNIGQKTSGNWSIVERAGRHYVELGANFRARKAPDLKIYLSRRAAASLGNKNGLKDTVFIAKLKSSAGKQSYALPKGVTPADFASLVIYCEAYSKFWAAAAL